MDPIIISLSGRKQAGKNTASDYICEYYVKMRLAQSQDGQADYFNEIMLCSFADLLKEFCTEVLGLPTECCHGTENQKNAPTNYLWENVPDFYRWKFGPDEAVQNMIRNNMSVNTLTRLFAHYDNPQLRSGAMSGREIMQFFGTDLIRHSFGNVWAAATIRRICQAGQPLAIISDNRFPDEVREILKQPKGYIIRLTRSPTGLNDIHPSESSLDGFDWAHEHCFVLDNAQMTIEEQNQATMPILREIFGQ
jgi:hypothetical protein